MQARAAEASRLSASKAAELGNARGVVDQLRKELDGTRHAKVCVCVDVDVDVCVACFFS